MRVGQQQVKLRVVGIGCDGFAGLSARATEVLCSASRIIGAPRQLSLLDRAPLTAKRCAWPRGFWKDWQATLADLDPVHDVILASGDPMFHGIGATLVRHLGRGAVEVIPAPSSVSLACAHLGWSLHTTPVVSLVTGPAGLAGAARVVPVADTLRPFLVLCRSSESIRDVAQVLADRPETTLTALTNLGGTEDTGLPQSVAVGTVANPPVAAGDLTVLAVEPSGSTRGWLADDDFDSDGQLTKAPIRQATVAALDPRPGALLWDVGGGTGSIGIEWARHGGRAEIFERDVTRAARIEANAAALSGNVTVYCGEAPAVLGESSQRPDAVFIGGGLTADGMIECCWQRLASGGRIVANTVTLESEALLWQARRHYGGEITRLSVERAGAVGRFTAWRPALPVVQWSAVKDE